MVIPQKDDKKGLLCRVNRSITCPHLLVIFWYSFLLQLMFFSEIGDLVPLCYARVSCSSIALVLFLVFCQSNRLLYYFSTAFFLLWALLVILSILFFRYFCIVPTSAVYQVFKHKDEVRDQFGDIVSPDLIGMLLMLLVSIFLLLRFWKWNKRKPRRITLIIGIAIAVGINSVFIWYENARHMVTDKYADDFIGKQYYQNPSRAIITYGYFPYLLYHNYFVTKKINYESPLSNPQSYERTIPLKPRDCNFLFIQIQNLENALIGKLSNGVEVTPFLNRLSREAIYFPNFYAPDGDEYDAEFQAITGLLPLVDEPTLSVHGLHGLPTIAKSLHKRDYHCVAIYPKDGNLWNRRNAYKQLGFDSFLDESSFPHQKSIAVNSDFEFLDSSLKHLREIGNKDIKFFAYLIHPFSKKSVSSHTATLGEGIRESNQDSLSNLVHAKQVDSLLEDFYDRLDQAGLAENTYIFIFGDKTSGVNVKGTPSGMYKRQNVPLLILTPENIHKVALTYSNHLDIPATVADIAGVSMDRRWFSRSLLRWEPDRCLPLVLSETIAVIGPKGKIPIEFVKEPIYNGIVEYSKSYFYSIDANNQPKKREKVSLTEVKFIAHALGNVDGVAYTNSREAFINSYRRGLRYFEADFSPTRDGHLVLFHDGFERRLGLEKNVIQCDLIDILECSFDNKYTILDVNRLFFLMQEYPEIFVITDTKGPIYQSIHYLIALAQSQDAQLIDRIIPQIYHPAELEQIRELHAFPAIILTLYRNTMKDEDVIEFVRSTGGIIQGVTMSVSRFSPSLVSELRELGLAVFVHTINNPNQMDYFHALGVTGFYTDIPGDPISLK